MANERRTGVGGALAPSTERSVPTESDADKVKAEAEAKAKEVADAAAAEARAESEAKEAQARAAADKVKAEAEAKAKRPPRYLVAPGKALSAGHRGILGPGEEVQAKDVGGDAKRLDHLVTTGRLVKR